MNHFTLRIILLLGFLQLLLPSFSMTAFADVEGYTLKRIEGRKVYVEEISLAEHTEKTKEALTLLQVKLQEIDQMDMNEAAKTKLRSITFFVEWKRVENGAAVYHPSEVWLANNGWRVEKAKSVNITNVTNFINWTAANQPYMVLHELAHAYHHQILGYDHTDVLNAFDQAMKAQKYDEVGYFNGNNTTKKKAYAATNVQEYFAEMTEAYFGKNDFYPFNKSELHTHDPLAYAVLQKVWQTKLVAPTPTPITPPITDEVLFDSDKYYRLTTKWQGKDKSLDVVNDGKNNKLQLANTGNYTGQYWRIEKLPNGYYRLTTKWKGEGKSLDVMNDGRNNRLQ
ncbi:MAG: hypothetical protein ACPGXL_09095, partial [Chitinophagales bacterium]